MKKQEYILHLLKDNETSGDKQKLYADVIDCVDIALSQSPDELEIDTTIGLKELFAEIEEAGRKSRCVGPFEAAELLAKKMGTEYKRITRKFEAVPQTKRKVLSLEDFI